MLTPSLAQNFLADIINNLSHNGMHDLNHKEWWQYDTEDWNDTALKLSEKNLNYLILVLERGLGR
jgi:hypothetical protein